MDSERGRLLLQGVNTATSGGFTYGRQATYLGVWVFLALLATVGLLLTWDEPQAGSVAFRRVFTTSVALMPIIVLLTFVPLEIDGIWENGVSGRRTMVHRLASRTYIPYDRIARVQIDKMSFGRERWKRLTMKDQEDKVVLRFGYQEHNNGFYEAVLGALERRCPNARWVERYVNITGWGRETTPARRTG